MITLLNSIPPDPKKLDAISSDVLRNVRINKSFLIWSGFLLVALLICLYAYTIQLHKGLGVTGMRDVTSWGMYIANFVFFVASSLVGMLISSVLGLIGEKWITPIKRIAEIIAVAFAAVAGLVIISDMGRPERLPFVFMYARVQSPIVWDVTVVVTYFVISFLLWFLPMIPDLAVARTRINDRPSFLVRAYDFMSFRWMHLEAQYRILKRAIRILLILIVPMAFAIHTVTSWLFALTPRTGWDSTIFGPYFIAGAFVAGTSAVIMAMYFFRVNYKLHAYITEEHFEKMGRVLALISIIYIYFNINEFLVPGYKLKTQDAIHLRDLFSGDNALLFWGTQLAGLIIPALLLLIRFFRKPIPLLVISFFVFAGAWLKRLIIVVPPEAHPNLPVQRVPAEWVVYEPTLIEILVTAASFLIVLIIITLLSKLFPVIPIVETASGETGITGEAPEHNPVTE